MRPFLLTATAAVFVVLALWFRLRGAWKNENGAYFILFLLSGAFCAALTAASWWVGDREASLYIFMASRIFYGISAFAAFIFARSFASGADYRLFFWSVPLQLMVAVIVANGEGLYVREGMQWVADRSYPAFFINAVVLLLYFLFAVYHISALLLALRRERKEGESRQAMVLLAAMLLFLCAGILGNLLGMHSDSGRSLPLSELIYLVGVLLLSLTFHGWAAIRGEPGEMETAASPAREGRRR